ncbi:MAG TPA: outer membrane protein assembly factor BamA [Terriglobales bacterium]|nr:outer membrane protein assembly factor BamA [Terriglobales bacterium]
MKRLVLVLALLMLPGVLAAQEILEKIEVVGNDRVSRETIIYYLSIREGDYFNDDQVRRDFKVLWSTGFFANLKVEDLPGTRGKIIRITVEENPVIKAVVYKTGKKVKESDIVSKLKEKDQNILPYSYYSPGKVQKVKRTISDLLADKGLLAAKIDTEVRKTGKNEVELLVRIDEGPKVRIGEVAFEGDPKLPESTLVWSMKDNRPHTFFNWVAGKDVYKQGKVKDDIDLIKKTYQENGFMEASVGQPRIEEMTKRTVLFKKQKMMRLVIPVNPGYLYRVGEIRIDGNKAFAVKGLRTMVKLQPGDVYSTKLREKTVEDIQELYRNWGYLYMQVTPVENLDPKNKVVNVTFNIYEGEIVYLNRLEFKGNNYTKDKVIRREMLLAEGERFSLARFKDSVLRIKQLGLVDLEKDPEFKPNPDDPTKMDLVVNVKELQRNNIQFSAGYSGYDGTFLAFSYSTVNFLGAGENVDFQVQQGKRVKNYSVGFTEPYLFDQPVTAGFNVYDRYYDYSALGLYTQKAIGVDLTLGARILGYWRASATYNIQKVNISYAAGSTLSTLYGSGAFYESSITPMIYRSTIDSPLTPTRGTLYSASVKLAGSFLGGDINIIKPQFEFAHYQPFIANHVIGVHFEYDVIKSYRGSAAVPYWEKAFLGGERSIRGYEVYSIGPRNESGYNLGGDKSFFANFEYIIPVGGPLYAIFFYDLGNSLAAGEKFTKNNIYTSTGIEARIFVPALRVPFRLIFSYNNRPVYPNDGNFKFRFAVGTTF